MIFWIDPVSSSCGNDVAFKILQPERNPLMNNYRLLLPVGVLQLTLGGFVFNRFFNGIKTSSFSALMQSKVVWLCAVLALISGILMVAPVRHASKADTSIISEAQATEASPQAVKEAAENPVANIEPMTDADASFSIADVRQQKKLSAWIANNYRISSTSSDLYVSTAYKTAFDLGLDPHLILAIMAIESRYQPNARGAGSATGLMQVVTRVHAKRFAPYGGVQAATDPVVNIKIGATILKELIKQKGGSVERAVKAYAGGNGGYNSNVRAQYRKLKAVTGSDVDAFAKPAKNLSRQAG